MSTHTPGPLMHVGSILNAECGCKDCQAALSLIAAAPRMLEIVRIMATGSFGINDDIREQARAILRDVEGESNG